MRDVESKYMEKRMKTEGGEDEDKDAARRPPETKELYDMLYDDIEERHVRDFGIAADDPSYAGALALFKTRLGPDLDEAVRCTRASRGAAKPSSALSSLCCFCFFC